MSIRHYAHATAATVLLPVDPNEDLRPGSTVKYAGQDHSWGTVVANTDDFVVVVWSHEPATLSDLFSRFAAPLVRRVNTPSLAKSLVSVQPMPLPSGKIFYTNYSYGSLSGSV